MDLSIFDLFKVGIGPSSSHTVGPMWAAWHFVHNLEKKGVLSHVRRVFTELYGALSATGRGHATDKAILLGLSGERPDTIDPESSETLFAQIRSACALRLVGRFAVPFEEASDIFFHEESLPRHPNGLRLSAFDATGYCLS